MNTGFKFTTSYLFQFFTYFQILKYEPPTSTSDDDEDDLDSSESNKKIERQESTISNISSSGKFNFNLQLLLK